MYYLIIILIIILGIYFFYRSAFTNQTAVIVYSDGEVAQLPPGKWFINADVAFSSHKIWGLTGYEGKTSIATLPDKSRDLLQWVPLQGLIVPQLYRKFFIEV